ncbi:hypothetical protein LCGC14_1995550 [marine sediment metagenome]|uniref:4Fe-4S ferredoxin-type domain-containing protein n=1 Tax=marine sediment metagenome TaxID=412755 RepID=A0A0F9FSU5_9ZZZZ
MGQKVSPIGFRTGIRLDWKSRWFAPKSNYGEFLVEDYHIRKFIDDRLNRQPPYAAIGAVQVERTREEVKVTVETARPGLVIGPRGAEVEKLKEAKKKSAEQDQVDFLEAISSLCINCHNCRAVCPICYCKQCVFDGEVFKYTIEKYLTWSGKKGVLPMPADKLLFHLTRMSHVATSCVACGQCEAACPNGIPLGRIYQKISTAAQEALGYEAGRSLDEELPLTTFREDELSVVEN